MHVDGFRFDLASALARGLHEVDRLGPFFDLIQQDPVTSGIMLIAEPWDVGEGGYQVGNFPPMWSEWNGRCRDTVRDYWRGEPVRVPVADQRCARTGGVVQVDRGELTVLCNLGPVTADRITAPAGDEVLARGEVHADRDTVELGPGSVTVLDRR